LISQSSSDVRCMSYLKQSPQTKYTTEDLELRPNTLFDFAASSQCIRNAFWALVDLNQSFPIDPIEYIGLRSLLAYVDHASAVAIL
jgi:hypothetical protein